MLDIESLKNRFRAKKKALETELKEFIAFQTISADPDYLPHFGACAAWLEKKLISMGAHVEIWNKEGRPIIFAALSSKKEDAPTLLLYNHYDVQPVDPLDEWKSDPFAATIEGETIRGRGVSDDKGQCLFVLSALEEFVQKGLPCNIKFLFEGEEETASTTLIQYCETKKEALQADYSMVIDLGMRERGIAAIPIGTRGVTALSLTLHGINQDLHSGTYGGLAPNPLQAISSLLATLHNADGSVAVPGFYDGVRTLSDKERSELSLSMNEEKWENDFGQPPVGGEQAFSPLERAGVRPTLEINGISGGYTGAGIKTVIPREAKAKISCRLVADQKPEEIAEKVRSFLLEKTPKGTTLDVEILEGKGEAYRARTESPVFLAVEKAMEMVWGKRPEKMAEGGSIPIIPVLQEASQSDLVCWGVTLPSDRIHAPNENISFEQLEQGFLTLSLAIEFLGASE